MKKILPLFALLSVTTCYAGDASTTEFLGFSPDGSVVGFQEFGVYLLQSDVSEYRKKHLSRTTC